MWPFACLFNLLELYFFWPIQNSNEYAINKIKKATELGLVQKHKINLNSFHHNHSKYTGLQDLFIVGVDGHNPQS